MNTTMLLGVVQADEVLAMRIIRTIAVLSFAAVGALIYRKRHQLFDRDPHVLQ